MILIALLSWAMAGLEVKTLITDPNVKWKSDGSVVVEQIANYDFEAKQVVSKKSKEGYYFVKKPEDGVMYHVRKISDTEFQSTRYRVEHDRITSVTRCTTTVNNYFFIFKKDHYKCLYMDNESCNNLNTQAMNGFEPYGVAKDRANEPVVVASIISNKKTEQESYFKRARFAIHEVSDLFNNKAITGNRITSIATNNIIRTGMTGATVNPNMRQIREMCAQLKGNIAPQNIPASGSAAQ